jgi:hypothetical protein
MAEEAGSIGVQLDLTVRAGDTLGPFVVTIDDEGVPINLTGCTFDAAVSKLNTDDGVLPITVTVTDAPNGKCVIKAADTQNLDDDSSNFFNAQIAYSWYFKMTDTAGTKRTYLFGYVKVAAELPT